MGRKKTIGDHDYRFSLVLDEDNKYYLDLLSKREGITLGATINLLLSMLLQLPDTVNYELQGFVRRKIQYLLMKDDISRDPFEMRRDNEDREYYNSLLRVLSRNSYSSEDKVGEMRSIQLREGKLLLPSDWIILNEDKVQDCLYAYAISCRNASVYNVPVMLYVSDIDNYMDLVRYHEREIMRLCVNAYPPFKDIIEMQVEPQMDPERPGLYANESAHLKCPYIGIHPISDEKEPWGGHPFGCRIVR